VLKLIYDALWYPVLPVAALASAGLDRQKLKQRLGRIEAQADAGQPRVWLHAASVGEVEGARPIALGLSLRNPAPALFITCMTETGCQAARAGICGARAVMLAPLDCRACVRRFLRAVRPHTLLIAETELWPNYLLAARRAGIPLAIINGRLSTRSFTRYRALRSIFRSGLESVALVLAQSDEDAGRYAMLGVPQARITVVGNPKFDLEWLRDPPSLRPQLEAFTRGRRVFVAGSTAPGEEAIMIEAYRGLRRRFPDLALVLAPRHPHRAAEVEAMIRAARLDYVRAGELRGHGQPRADRTTARGQAHAPQAGAEQPAGEPTAPDATAGRQAGKGQTASGQTANGHDAAPDLMPFEHAARAPALLLDTLGELRALYFHATLAFVGGSIRPGRGGQSLAEPAAAALPVMFGPYHESQRMVARALLQSGAGCIVRDAGEIVEAAAPLLSDANLRRTKGERARAAVKQLGGAAERSLMALSRLSSLG
jgi:3-deoxy-D-manno-octulosonic-acid transferase